MRPAFAYQNRRRIVRAILHHFGRALRTKAGARRCQKGALRKTQVSDAQNPFSCAVGGRRGGASCLVQRWRAGPVSRWGEPRSGRSRPSGDDALPDRHRSFACRPGCGGPHTQSSGHDPRAVECPCGIDNAFGDNHPTFLPVLHLGNDGRPLEQPAGGSRDASTRNRCSDDAGGAGPTGPAHRAALAAAGDAVLDGRQPAVEQPCLVARLAEPERVGTEHPRGWRQVPGRLHGLLGAGNAHDENRVARGLRAHHAGVPERTAVSERSHACPYGCGIAEPTPRAPPRQQRSIKHHLNCLFFKQACALHELLPSQQSDVASF